MINAELYFSALISINSFLFLFLLWLFLYFTAGKPACQIGKVLVQVPVMGRLCPSGEKCDRNNDNDDAMWFRIFIWGQKIPVNRMKMMPMMMTMDDGPAL